MESEVRSSMPDLPPTSEIARLARSPSALLNHLSNMSSDEEPDGTFQPPAGRTARPRRRAVPRDAAGRRSGPPAPPPAPTPIRAGPVRRPRRASRPGSSSPATPASTERLAVVTLPFTAKRKSRPSPDNMTLGEHLGELRRRVIVCVIAFVVAATIAVFAYEPILHFLLRPLCTVDASTVHHTSTSTGSLLVASNGSCNLFVTSPLDGLSLRVKIALFGGLVLASPGHPVPGLALRHPRPQGVRAALRHPVRG